MQTKTSSKFALIACLAIGAGIATAVWASSTKSNLTSVKSDLGHSVQTIQEVVFTKDGLRPENDDQAVVRMKIDGKTLIFEGKVLVSREGVDNTLSADTTASTLFAGQRNTVAGNSSAVMAGVDGTIEPTAYGTAVL